MKSKQVLVLEYVFIVLLGVLMSLGYIFFVITNNFAPAGINGIAVMVQYKLNFSVGFNKYPVMRVRVLFRESEICRKDVGFLPRVFVFVSVFTEARFKQISV